MQGRQPTVALCALLLGTAAWGAPPPAGHYRFDPDHTFVTFEVMHFGTSTLRGRFGPLSGEADLDPATRSGYVGLKIGTQAVDTGMPVLDRRLCQKDLLNCDAEPTAYFVARRIDFDAAGRVFAVHGELTLRGISHPLDLTAQRFACRTAGEERESRTVCGGDFEGELLRSDYGASFGLPFIADPVRLKVQVEAQLAR